MMRCCDSKGVCAGGKRSPLCRNECFLFTWKSWVAKGVAKVQG